MRLRTLFRGDKTLWMVFLLLTIISLVEVYSSIGLYAYSMGSTKPTGLFLRHVRVVIMTYIAAIAISHVNYRYFSRLSMLAYVVVIPLLILLMALKVRWFRDIPIIGQFQPSEIAKLVVVLFVARLLTRRQDQADDIGTFFMAIISIFAVAIPIFPENFSTAAIIFVSCYIMMYFGGVKRNTWWTVLIVATVIVAATFLVMVNTGSYMESIERTETWSHRVDRWLHPKPDELSQENMASMAIARGGLFGKGIGSTIHARLMTQAHNDFIYAIIIEEMGAIGGLVVFLLYAIFYYRCIRIVRLSKGLFGALIVAGLSTMIFIQAMINMCVAVGALPVTGQTLPFISFGGTAYLFLGCGFGIIQAVAASENEQPLSDIKSPTRENEQVLEIDN
ncbi:MAG: FtsW/RodA/SpoVE family cell cycle protein [Bacteroidales bacterium]|nr:FtsW/RodA/SpoVE family cell cycle protein [Bacteroidales bacterium]